MKSCFTCRHKGIVKTHDNSLEHICRKEPPVVQLMLVPTPQGAQIRNFTAWPTVSDSDCCSHHYPELAS